MTCLIYNNTFNNLRLKSKLAIVMVHMIDIMVGFDKLKIVEYMIMFLYIRMFILDIWMFILDIWMFILDIRMFILDIRMFILDIWTFVEVLFMVKLYWLI